MIQTETHAGVTVLTLEHGKANAFDLELLEALDAALGAFRDSSSPALVLTGRGRIFSAGVDLPRLLREGRPYTEAFLPALDRVFYGLLLCDRPVVAALNGHAIAGGCVTACAADWRVAARGSGTIGAPELKVGVPFPPVALELVRLAVPRAALSEIVFRGATLDVEEAHRRGVVHEVVEAEELLEVALERALELAAIPAQAFAANKAQLRRPHVELLERTDDPRAVLESWCSPEVLGAVRAYVDRVLGPK